MEVLRSPATYGSDTWVLLIALGAHPKYIQAQLGHASIQTTLDRYGHLMPQLHQAEAQKLDQLVFPVQCAFRPIVGR